MQTIHLAVPDIAADDRRALEHVLGQTLRDDQRLTITVSSPEMTHAAGNPAVYELPDYLNIFKGLSDEEIADLESVILQRVNFSRTTE